MGKKEGAEEANSPSTRQKRTVQALDRKHGQAARLPGAGGQGEGDDATDMQTREAEAAEWPCEEAQAARRALCVSIPRAFLHTQRISKGRWPPPSSWCGKGWWLQRSRSFGDVVRRLRRKIPRASMQYKCVRVCDEVSAWMMPVTPAICMCG